MSATGKNAKFIKDLNEAELESFPAISFNKTERIDISAGIYLKAFFDHIKIEGEGYKIICSKSNRKIREVLQYLGIKNYKHKISHADILCWDLNYWDVDDNKELNFSKILMEEILPKTLHGKVPSKDFSSIASALQEVLSNCLEHAYDDKDIFKRFYLYAGEYLNTDSFTFCVLDRGCGFKKSLEQRDLKFNQKAFPSEGRLIKAAVDGQSGAGSPKDGRGEGLKSVLEKTKKLNGRFSIYSGIGYYSFRNNKESIGDRTANVKGSLISLTVPITEGNKIK